MVKGKVFQTLEEFELKNDEMTSLMLSQGIECERYASRLECIGGYFMELEDGEVDYESVRKNAPHFTT